MAIMSKADLQAAFSKGKRPKESQFWDWQDSYYHKTEDPIKITGWQFRSFFKDLRSDGFPILNGGFTIVDIPVSVTKLKKVRVFGKATANSPAPFTIRVSLAYYCDKLIPSLNGVPSTGNPFPTSFFAHPLVGNGTPTPFTITSSVPAFDGTFDFASIPKNVILEFIQVRFMQVTVQITAGTFPNTAIDPSYVYYGLEYE